MKKFLFLLISSTVFTWSANCGDLGYGSTAYGASGYGSTAYGSTAYSATAYGATEYGATAYGSSGPGAKGYGVNGYCAAVNSTAKSEPKVQASKPASTATPKTVPADTKETSTTANLFSAISDNSYKKYNYRLAFSLSYTIWNNKYAISPVGIDFDMAFMLRSGGDHFFVEYGIGAAVTGMYYHYKRSDDYYGGYYYYSDEYEAQQGWLKVSLDPQFLFGAEFGKIIVRLGFYGGVVGGPFPEKAHNPDPYLNDEPLAEQANNYHYGIAANFAFRISEKWEANIAIKYDLSDFSNDYPGFRSIGIGLGLLF